jgi:hypothetical protein
MAAGPPKVAGFLETVEAGQSIERIVPPGEFPTSPDAEAASLELQIIQHLRARRASHKQGGIL